MGRNHIGAHPLSTETPTGMPASARVRIARKRMAGPEARGSIAAASSRSRVVIEMSTWATPKNHNHSLASGPNFGIHLCRGWVGPVGPQPGSVGRGGGGVAKYSFRDKSVRTGRFWPRIGVAQWARQFWHRRRSGCRLYRIGKRQKPPGRRLGQRHYKGGQA